MIQTIPISGAAQLTSALVAATGGEVFALADGDYGDLIVEDRAFTSEVIIQSADVDGGAVFRSVTLDNVSRLAFDRIEVSRSLNQGEPTWTLLVDIKNSADVRLSRSDIHGSVDGNYQNDPGMMVENCARITVIDNTFHDLSAAATFKDITDLVVSGNDMGNLGPTGMNIVHVTNAVIADNDIHDTHMVSGDHPDLIHFGAWGGAAGPCANVIVRGNRLYEGSGTSTQGIFISDPSTFTFRDFLIEDNFVATSMARAISSCPEINGLTIRRNTAIAIPNKTGIGGAMLVDEGAQNVVIQNNVVASYAIPAAASASGNIVAQSTDPLAANYHGDLFINPFGTPTPVNHLPVPSSAVDFGAGLGGTAALAGTDKPPVYIVATPGAGVEARTVSFAANPYPGGRALSGGAIYQWDFGDGATAVGRNVAHSYANSGRHDATLAVTDGTYTTAVPKTIMTTNPLLVDMRFDGAATNAGSSGGVAAWQGTPGYVAGVDGQAADFDANGAKHVEIAGASARLSGMKQLTLSFDVRFDSLATDAAPIDLAGAYYFKMIPGGTARFVINTDGGSRVLDAPSTTLANGAWHHVTASYDGTAGVARLYVDGALAATQSGWQGRVAPTAHDLIIGRGTWSDFFDGQIDNLRIYSGVVPPDEEADIYDGLTA